MELRPDLDGFAALARGGARIPVRLEISADLETPVTAFLKLGLGEEHAFLFESVEGGERVGRWSLLGAGPRSVRAYRKGDGGDPLAPLTELLAEPRALRPPDAPPFAGGLVGYLGYEMAQLFEPSIPSTRPDELGFPDALWMDFDVVVAFDSCRHAMQIVAEVSVAPGEDPRRSYETARRRIARTLRALRRPLELPKRRRVERPTQISPRTAKAEFERAVRRARAYIRAGDCQQVVLSQRFDARSDVPSFEIYRALRRINPSPYLFYIRSGEHVLLGSSPEALVRVEGAEVTLRPIAGTRPRGRSPAEDAARETELRADPKENAEHSMLVDLGRNDVGRVAATGTVRLAALRTVERYSHVMHLVSEVRGTLRPGLDAMDALRSAFPAGTVTGSPKVHAMQLIDELEPARRGPYAGCLGYLDRGGNLEMAIAIRTMLARGERLSVQAGAGIVFDSQPSAEQEETVHKAGALFASVEAARRERQGL